MSTRALIEFTLECILGENVAWDAGIFLAIEPRDSLEYCRPASKGAVFFKY